MEKDKKKIKNRTTYISLQYKKNYDDTKIIYFLLNIPYLLAHIMYHLWIVCDNSLFIKLIKKRKQISNVFLSKFIF